MAYDAWLMLGLTWVTGPREQLAAGLPEPSGSPGRQQAGCLQADVGLHQPLRGARTGPQLSAGALN